MREVPISDQFEFPVLLRFSAANHRCNARKPGLPAERSQRVFARIPYLDRELGISLSEVVSTNGTTPTGRRENRQTLASVGQLMRALQYGSKAQMARNRAALEPVSFEVSDQAD